MNPPSNSAHADKGPKSDTSSSVVSLSYQELLHQTPVAIHAAQMAFCNSSDDGCGGGFGALIITDIPHWTECHTNLLESGASLALDPSDAMREVRDSIEGEFRVAPGWMGMPGKETHSLQSGFYANLKAGQTDAEGGENAIWPDNKWPKEGADSPIALKQHVTEAGKVMYELTLQVLDLAQEALLAELQAMGTGVDDTSTHVPITSIPNLRQMAETSTFLPSRLVYYDANFSRPDPIESKGGDHDEYWLPFHVDFNLATALAPASWIKEDDALLNGSVQLNHLPETEAGLMLRSTSGTVVPAALKDDSVLIQLGALSHLSSGGLLRAGPHAVVKDKTKNGMGRLSYGVFIYGPMEAKMESSPELLEFLKNRKKHTQGVEDEQESKVLFTNDYGGLLEKSYTGETVFDGFKKFETYMNGS